MWFMKKIISKISAFFNSNKLYIFARLVVDWLIIFLFLWWAFADKGNSTSSEYLYVFGVAVLLRIIFDNFVIESLFHWGGKIKCNMKKLPKNIWSKDTIIEYSLPSGITPCEAAMILYRRQNLSDLLCLIYKWINEKKINIYIEKFWKYLEKEQDLDDNVPDYERYLFDKLFEHENWRILLSKWLLKQYVPTFNFMVVKTCIRKWYFYKNFFYSDSELVWPVIILLIFWSAFLWNYNIWLGWCLFFGFLWFLASGKYYINLTDKWEEVLSKIYWYKYYLEHCEEEKIDLSLKEDDFYNKHLPDAIALKLNWGMINDLL